MVHPQPLPSPWPAVEAGEGRPVVFVHGYPLDHRIWSHQLERIHRGHRYSLVDLPGYGSGHSSPVPRTLSGFAEHLHTLLDRQFGVPVVIVGHSFGGYIALELYRSHPHDFQGLVLTDTRPTADDAAARERRMSTVRQLTDNPERGLDVDATVRALVGPRTWSHETPEVERLRAIVRSVPVPTLIASLEAIAGRPDLTPVLADISVPTLVVWGEDDRLIPPAESRAMVPVIRGAVGVGIAGAGHLPFLEAPEDFARALKGFLDGFQSS